MQPFSKWHGFSLCGKMQTVAPPLLEFLNGCLNENYHLNDSYNGDDYGTLINAFAVYIINMISSGNMIALGDCLAVSESIFLIGYQRYNLVLVISCLTASVPLLEKFRLSDDLRKISPPSIKNLFNYYTISNLNWFY
ncbi:MAG: hypothetical protein JWQ54_764 [Mucilaginibacter sp.]|nr:hypothetical protein [Mucilaginibacter sp.]